MLELKDVHAQYGAIVALRGVSIHVAEGDLVGLLGANGAGKTTTLLTIAGVIKPSRGEITFRGVSPQAAGTGGLDRQRALVTIEFFALDDPLRRKNLLKERAMVIVGMFPYLQLLDRDPGVEPASSLIDYYTSNRASHAACARSFERLFESDPNEAQQIYDAAVAFVRSTS